MKSLVLFAAVVLCVVAVEARHVDKSENDKQTSDDLGENPGSLRDYRASQMRHRRKRWQMNYGYDYPQPPIPYYADRRDYDRNQDLIPQILRLLDEISAYVKRPNPPPIVPQPIYIPYPVPYGVPQNCNCNDQTPLNPNVTIRFPEMEDTNQNWGLTNDNQEILPDDGKDGARPISFDPIKPLRPMRRPPPSVEHGSVQGSSDAFQAPKQERTPAVTARCDAAILSCCKDQQRECFSRFDCPSGYARRSVVCSRNSIDAALQAFRDKYSPA